MRPGEVGPALEHEFDRAAVVVDVQPLTPVLRRRVERELPIVERVREKERNGNAFESAWSDGESLQQLTAV